MVLRYRPPCLRSAVVFVTVKNQNQTSTPLLTVGMPLGLVFYCIGVRKCQHIYQPSESFKCSVRDGNLAQPPLPRRDERSLGRSLAGYGANGYERQQRWST